MPPRVGASATWWRRPLGRAVDVAHSGSPAAAGADSGSAAELAERALRSRLWSLPVTIALALASTAVATVGAGGSPAAASGSITFEVPSGSPPRTTRPLTTDDCKQTGWAFYGVYANQGLCVSDVVAAAAAVRQS